MKKVFAILSFILLTAVYTQAQSRTNPSPNSAEVILKFYPNPATSIITFDFLKGYEKGLVIQVFNFLGKPVFEAPNAASKTTINLSEFNRGVYIYQLRDQSGKIIKSGKFQVSK